MNSERFCFKLVYTVGSEPKKILSKFHYDLIDIDEKKRVGASVVYTNRKEKVIKLHFKNTAHADSFIHDDLKIADNVIFGTVDKTKTGLTMIYSIPNGREHKAEFKNYKELYDYSGDIKWEDMQEEKFSKKTSLSQSKQVSKEPEDVCPDF